MEKVRDLFNPAAGDSLKIRNDPKKGFYIADLSKMAVDVSGTVARLHRAAPQRRAAVDARNLWLHARLIRTIARLRALWRLEARPVRLRPPT